MTSEYNDEPIIEVTATPSGEAPRTFTYPMSTDSTTISGSTVPAVAKEQPDQAIQVATAYLDFIKSKYNPEEHDLVITQTEEEEIDRGWFSHIDLGGKISFDGGDWGAYIKGTPKKEKRTKKTVTRISLKKKGE